MIAEKVSLPGGTVLLSPELSEDEVEVRRLELKSKLGHRAGVNL